MADPVELQNSYSQELTTFVEWIANTSDESQTSGMVCKNFSVPTSTSLPKTQNSDSFGYTDIVYVTIGLVGIVDNFLAALVMLLHKPLRQRLANYFLVNKCIQDLLTGVFLVLQNSVKKATNLKGVALEVYCRLWSSKAIFLGLITSSLFSLAAVTFEKYLEIAYPIQHRVKMTKKMVLSSIAIVTAVAMAFKMGYIISGAKVVNGSCKSLTYPNFAAQVAVGTANFLVEYVLPLTVIAYSYVGMAKSLRKTVQPASIAKDIHPKMIRARRNIIKTLITVVLAFIICVSYKEFMITLQFYNLFKIDFNSWWFAASQTMTFLSCCVDPIIYLIQYEEFRRGARKLICKALPNRKKTPVVKEDTEFSMRTVEVY